jgi:porphobilinogen synthase
MANSLPCPDKFAGNLEQVSQLPNLPGYPVSRPRRLRANPALRRLTNEVAVRPADLILPMFVREGISDPTPINSMPGVLQHTFESLAKAATEAVEAGIGGLMLFGVPTHKDAQGSGADDPDGVLNKGLRVVRDEVGDATVVMADLCLDEFTDHGHCGVLDAHGHVDNDSTLLRYQQMGVAQAEAGAHLVGTSGMMDGQVGAVRSALDASGFVDTAILAYSAKYASAFYGPFREAVDSSLVGDRQTYQQDHGRSVQEALAEVALDVAEGADAVMVKPALPYLDILAAVAAASPIPVAAYQVSGEYAMVEAAARNGWIDRDRAMLETLTSIRRAGASMILTYWAVEAAGRLR